ncbi:MAG: sigma-70 family RNA polymerase sigma factor [Acidimicrobiales bacterium]
MLAATIRVTGDIDLAEECVQDAYSKALTNWRESGIPMNVGAWLTTVARRRAIDVLRRRSTQERLFSLMEDRDNNGSSSVDGEHRPVDDRLRLIFTCCHPALSVDTQVALTLKLLCGLTTPEVARAFLVNEATMAARITRAKKKISTSHIPYRVPTAEDLPERIDAVLSVVHLVFATGHTAPSGSDLVRDDLVVRSLELARMLRELLPAQSDVTGLLALILLTDARRRTRTSPQGDLLLLSQQDRSQWDHDAIEEGTGLVREALRQGPAGRFALMAAIAALHAASPSWENTDWDEIVALYDLLVVTWPSPVVALNRAAAIGLARGPDAGLDALAALDSEPYLSNYSYLASTRATFLRDLGRRAEARASFEEALEHSENEVERAFLRQQIEGLKGSGSIEGSSTGR